jgi:hypothetical protein
MDTLWTTALWRQFGAAIDTFDNALAACPPALWTQRLWHDPPDQPLPPWCPPQFAEFWFLAYHTIFWLDLYLTGAPEEEFAPPAPFAWLEIDDAPPPERPYTPEALRAYLATTRRKCHATLLGLTDEQARRPVEYPWAEGKDVSFLELQLYTMRHVQEHAAQLNLFLGQQSVPGERDSVTRAGCSGQRLSR